MVSGGNIKVEQDENLDLRGRWRPGSCAADFTLTVDEGSKARVDVDCTENSQKFPLHCRSVLLNRQHEGSSTLLQATCSSVLPSHCIVMSHSAAALPVEKERDFCDTSQWECRKTRVYWAHSMIKPWTFSEKVQVYYCN